MKNRIIFLFLILLWGREAWADTLTGGISRVRIEDYVIIVRGGIIQSCKDFTLNIWMLGLEGEIRIGKNPPYFEPNEEYLPILSQPNLPKEITLSLPTMEGAFPKSSTLSSTIPNGQEDSFSGPEQDDSAPGEQKGFIINLINVNSSRIMVEGDAEIFRDAEDTKSSEAQADREKKRGKKESNRITLKTSFPEKEETSRIRITTRYPKTDYFRFVVMGDSKDGLDIYKSILQKVRNIRPLFFAHLGDIVGNGTRREYQQILRLMSQVNFPFFISIGNNDALSQGRTVYHYWLGPTYYSLDYRDSHFVFLDDSSGLIDENQFHWLREDLQRNQSKKIFLFMHIPPYDPRQARSYEITAPQNVGWLMDLAKEFGVKRIYSSHINSYFKFNRQGIPIVITGGAGSRLASKKKHHHFLLITVKGDQIIERVVLVN